MNMLRNLFRARERHVLQIADEHQPQLQSRYGGQFDVKGLSVFDRQGRLRGFVFQPGDPTPARIQSYVAGARQTGQISEDLVRTLFAHIQREDFVVQRSWTRDVVVFPSDIYQPHRLRPSASPTDVESRRS
jgi:hypothetical protein